MAIKFTKLYKHGRLTFLPGGVYGFEDPDADEFFQKVSAAEATTEEPVHVFGADEVDIDPDTVFQDGTPVLIQPKNVTVTTGGAAKGGKSNG